MTNTRTKIFILGSILLFTLNLLIEGCNSDTPLEYNNPNDPLSDSYVSTKTLAPFDLRFTFNSDSGFTISWQDTNKWLYVQRLESYFDLEKSINNGPFFELALLKGNINSFIDNAIDTSNIYKYRIREVSKYDTSNYSSELTIQYTVVDAEVEKVLDLGSAVHSLIISPDGTMLAATGATCILKVWQIENFNLIVDYKNSTSLFSSLGWPYTAAFNLDSKMIATNAEGPNNEKVNIWKLTDGTLVKQIHGDGGNDARSICFSSDGSKILTGNFDGKVRFWDIASDSLVKTIQAFSGLRNEVNLLYITNDGTGTIVGAYGSPGTTNPGIRIWRNDNWSTAKSFNGFQNNYYSVSLDEKYLTFGGSIMSLEDGAVIQSFTGYSGTSFLTYDNRFLIGQQENGLLFVGQVSDGKIKLTKEFLKPTYSFPAIACLPNSYEFFATGSANRKINLWKLKIDWISK